MSEAIAQQDVYGEMRHQDIARFVPAEARSAIDIGCGRGGFGITLREHLGPEARIVGLEAVAEAAAIARRDHGFDEVFAGYFPDALRGTEQRFDVLTFNDVLEHMVEPWDVLRECHSFLNPGGRIVAVIPSIQYFPVVLRLLRGRWDYEDKGTLDRTHLRFFTRATMVEMFESTGYTVQQVVGVHGLPSHVARETRLPVKLAKQAVSAAVGDMKYLQFAVVATPR